MFSISYNNYRITRSDKAVFAVFNALCSVWLIPSPLYLFAACFVSRFLAKMLSTRKTRMTGLPYTEESMTICQAILIQYIVESCPLTRRNGSLSRLHSADKGAVSWLTNCG